VQLLHPIHRSLPAAAGPFPILPSSHPPLPLPDPKRTRNGLAFSPATSHASPQPLAPPQLARDNSKNAPRAHFFLRSTPIRVPAPARIRMQQMQRFATFSLPHFPTPIRRYVHSRPHPHSPIRRFPHSPIRRHRSIRATPSHSLLQLTTDN